MKSAWPLSEYSRLPALLELPNPIRSGAIPPVRSSIPTQSSELVGEPWR